MFAKQGTSVLGVIIVFPVQQEATRMRMGRPFVCFAQVIHFPQLWEETPSMSVLFVQPIPRQSLAAMIKLTALVTLDTVAMMGQIAVRVKLESTKAKLVRKIVCPVRLEPFRP